MLLFVSVNVIGLYIHDKLDYALHKVFNEACNCISARIDVEDESSKLVSTGRSAGRAATAAAAW